MQTVVITGVSKGIGKALLEKFIAEGWQVAGTYLSEAPRSRENLTLYRLDLASPESIKQFATDLATIGTKVDILINNAGVLLDGDDTLLDPQKLRSTLEVNVIGTAALTEQLIPVIQKGGHIVNISSTAGSLNRSLGADHFPGYYPAYKISKAALNMYTRTLAERLEPQRITVSSVHPGWVRTEMGGEAADMTPEQAAEGIYTLAIAKPETGQFWFGMQQIPW